MPHDVLITGCSVGLGRATALHLARGGARVFAGVRSEADAGSLRGEDAGPGMLEPILLDVLDAGSVENARKRVEAAVDAQGLHGLVNNAGLNVNLPVEVITEGDIAHQMGVNCFGPVRLIQAFLPLLRTARGRIVNVTSGITKASYPFSGLYAASKAALDQLSHTLRLELEPDGVRVILVDPGLMRTRMTADPVAETEATIARWPRAAVERYGPRARANSSGLAGGLSGAKQPEVVAALIARALGEANPRDQYLCGIDARLVDWLNRLLPWRLKQRLVKRAIEG